MDPDWLDDAPLLRAWRDAQRGLASGELRPFTIPGHKQDTRLIGEVVRGDLPMYGALGSVRDGAALLLRAEERAAARAGADWCRYSVGGSTHCNQGLVLAVGAPGDTVIVDRTSHRSLLLGLVLAGLRPVWVRPPIHAETGLPLGLEVSTVADALAAHPEARAVLVTSPSYVGTVSDVAGLAEVAHAAGVPLLVDAAWGAHFGSHPDLPPDPFGEGADAVVTSAHKTLPALNQGAVVRARTDRLDRGRLDRGMDAGMTTSPSGSILAGIDGALALMAHEGEALGAALLDRVRRARDVLRRVPGLLVPDTATFGQGRFDEAKLVILLAGTGVDGIAADRVLASRGFALEMSDRDLWVPMVTVADDDEGVAALADAVARVVEEHRGEPRPVAANAAWSVAAEQVLTPREAFFSPREPVAWEQAAGRICAEVVAPYPPGIPVLAPGERIPADALEALRQARADGARIAYAADPTLATVQVVRAVGSVDAGP